MPTPREVLELAKKHGAKLVDLKFIDLPGIWQHTTVTIGGVPAQIDFVGIPWFLVGVTQINVTVPDGIAAGSQPVVVSVDGVLSPPATITITN